MKFKFLCFTIAGAIVLTVSGFAFAAYEGTLGPFLVFDVSYLLLISLAVPKPRLYAYTFLSIFLFLGFWTKFMAHTIINYDFVEPIGDFDGSGSAWDLALLVSAAAALGVVAVRGVHLLYFRFRYVSIRSWESANIGGVPPWYARFRKPVWIATVFFMIALNVWNVYAAFYQTGVSARVILPLHLNILASWLINLGFALWIAALIYWEAEFRRGVSGRALLLPILEGVVATTTQLSRGIYLFHTVPYLLVLIERRLKLRMPSKKKTMGALSLLFLFAFVVSLASVSLLRLQVYPTITVTPTSTTIQETTNVVEERSPTNLGAQRGGDGNAVRSDAPQRSTGTLTSADQDTRRALLINTTGKVLRLSVDRWIGLGGVLAVSSYPELGHDLLAKGIREDPATGENSLYQRISGADDIYEESEQFTFLALAGSVAVLAYSGSLYVVAFGMAAITLIVVSVELTFSRLIGNPVLLSVSGLAMANIVSQLNFPYLAGIFLAKLLVTLLFIWALQASPTLGRVQTVLAARWRSTPS
jgi:hypothetical protein